MSRYVLVRCDGEIRATYESSGDKIVLDLGAATIDLALDDVTRLRELLAEALACSALPKCPECHGKKILRVDGKSIVCPTCDYTGMAPQPEVVRDELA